jgi:serine/threonine protein phosphatase PrpC
MKYYALTDVGLTRTNNQDGLLLERHSAAEEKSFFISGTPTKKDFFAVVLDGVGGTAHGELSVKYALDYLKQSAIPKDEAEIFELVNELNLEVNKEYNQTEVITAATIAGLVVSQDSVFAFNVGDSAIYLINNGYLQEVSISDTMSSLAAGLSDTINLEDGASKSPLMQYLGKKDAALDVHVCELSLPKQVLACTDGLTDMLGLDGIENIIAEHEQDHLALVNCLHSEALKKGALDNLTFFWLDFDEG